MKNHMISNIIASEPVLNLAWCLHYSCICLGPLTPGFFSYVYGGGGGGGGGGGFKEYVSLLKMNLWSKIWGSIYIAGDTVIFPSYQHLGLGTLHSGGLYHTSNHRPVGLEGPSRSHQIQPPV